jgi:hypothetical protein
MGYNSEMKTNVLQIRLSEEEKANFEKAAEDAGISVSAWVRDRLRTAAIKERLDNVKLYIHQPAPKSQFFVAEARPIWEEIAEVGASIPEAEWDKLPRDLARNVDHYLDSSNW